MTRMIEPCFQQSVAYRWRLFVLDWCWLSHILWFLTRRCYGKCHIWYRARSSVFALGLLSFVLAKTILMWRCVLVDVSGNAVKSVWRDREAGLRKDIAAPTTVFRTWRTIDRKHFAEIVWFGSGVRTLWTLPWKRRELDVRRSRRATSFNPVTESDANMVGALSFVVCDAVMWFSSFRKTQRRRQREEDVFHRFVLFCLR